MRWTWEYLGETRVLHDDGHQVPMTGCVHIRVAREQGTGIPPNKNVLEERVQQSAGRVWLFNYLDSRTIQLMISLFGKEALDIGSEDIVTAKRLLTQWFNPQPSAPDGVLTFVGRDGVVRAIKARYDSGLEYDWLYLEQGEFVNNVNLICADPLWYDPEEQSVQWESDGQSLILCDPPDNIYKLPFALCVGVGASQDITNAGDWATYPIITIDGPAFDVTIQNTTTGETISATYNIAAGKTVTYDLSPGAKTVTDSDGNNLIGDLVQPNDLARFHLASAYEYDDSGNQIAPGGVNSITVTSGATATVANMTWFNRYLSN